MMKYLQSELFECICRGDEHTLKFTFAIETDSKQSEVYTALHLNDYQVWYKKLWTGIKYVFGYRCKYGHWDVFTLKRSDVTRLRKLLQEFEEAVPEQLD